MYTQFFRSFYLIFAALFGMLFFGAAAIVVSAARVGDPPSTLFAVAIAGICANLVARSIKFMRE